MKTSHKGISLIQEFEGCQLKAYKCPAGIWTIGYGNTFYENNQAVKQGDIITKDRAISLMANLLPKFEFVVAKKINIVLNQNQFDALVSYVWNTGGSNTLYSLINKKAPAEQIRTWFETKYISGDGQVLAGLVRRRKAEVNLYFS